MYLFTIPLKTVKEAINEAHIVATREDDMADSYDIKHTLEEKIKLWVVDEEPMEELDDL